MSNAEVQPGDLLVGEHAVHLVISRNTGFKQGDRWRCLVLLVGKDGTPWVELMQHVRIERRHVPNVVYMVREGS